MSLESILFLLLFSAICGVLGQFITGQPRGDLLAVLAVGFIGALFGSWLSGLVGLPALFIIRIGIFNFSFIWSILGAALLMGVVGLFMRRYYAYY